MIYLDYSATTPVDATVIDKFIKISTTYIGNPNSLHKLGRDAKQVIDDTTLYIANLLGVLPDEIIYTSGASESNNLAIKGLCTKNAKKGKHIITSEFEHSSVIAPINYLQKQGFDVDFIKLDANGLVDLKHFKALLKDTTILVSLASVNSELGMYTQVEEIGKILLSYPNCTFHVDATQSLGKENIDLTNVDLASFSAQKSYGLKGIGLLVKKNDVIIEPIIHGGKSTTIFRSGTPALGLIASLAPTFAIAYDNEKAKFNYVKSLNDDLRIFFKQYKNVYINSPLSSIPHILNISIKGIDANDMLSAFDKKDIYISTQTACAFGTTPSRSVLVLTGDIELAKSSIRISLSYLTTKDELNTFKQAFDLIYKEFNHEDINL